MMFLGLATGEFFALCTVQGFCHMHLTKILFGNCLGPDFGMYVLGTSEEVHTVEIVGGTVASLLVLAILGFAIWWLRRKKQKGIRGFSSYETCKTVRKHPGNCKLSLSLSHQAEPSSRCERGGGAVLNEQLEQLRTDR